jgi:LmbE family N-acetylglucosaminyl deacetylase
VVAHPDDEVLGAGGFASRMASQGVTVQAAILCGQVTARALRPADGDLDNDLREAARTLGMLPPLLGDFPNIRMNTVPHLDLVQFVEGAIEAARADLIITHHPGDLNDDHRQVSGATQAAARLPQRRSDLSPVRSLHFMEVQSSTDWAYPPSDGGFTPNSFIELGKDHLEKKLAALACYRDVMRPYPHPRSSEAIRGLAQVRGAQAGMIYAESFDTRFMDLATLL